MARVKVSWARSTFSRTSGYYVRRGEDPNPFNHAYRDIFFVNQPIDDNTAPAINGVISVIDDKNEVFPGAVWNPDGLTDLDSPTKVDGQTLYYTVVASDIQGFISNEFLEGHIVFTTGVVPTGQTSVTGPGTILGGHGMCCPGCAPQPLCCVN
jgi:hypothetical protein